MARTALTPVFVGLRTGLHALFFALIGVVVARAVLVPSDSSAPAIVLALVLAATYAAGALLAHLSRGRRVTSLLWLAMLSAEWLGLLWVSADAAYLVFPLFFLYLHLLGRWVGTAAILAATVVAVFALGIHGGWSVGGVVGPFVGAGVALLIGLGYQALATEARQREALVDELLTTRGQLAAREHESGVLAERARLAREIHDTLAQGLSSIQMLLHAAERADPTRPGIEHIRLARETAAANLAEARRFIRELTPPQLDDQTLAGALRRLGATQWAAQGLDVRVRVSDTVILPMHLQTALLRITQGAIANVIQHAHATTATVTIAVEDDHLRFTVDDDGTGFDAEIAESGTAERSDSFGLRATAERVQQLGGRLEIDTASGRGTRLTVDLPLKELA
ncbi:sensor histidine kinase [uncultured Microbacterium sp.]|uniref:sensor histidine kinase n=1 Tax=uncultured Microbacterium sp. TaxID=191216 RepID=UPI0028D4383E|nr:sensor histidine kinase [uncultured Microbacterium sp.]